MAINEEVGQIYFCKKCGQEVIITKTGKGILVCCNQKMILAGNETDAEIDDESEEEESE